MGTGLLGVRRRDAFVGALTPGPLGAVLLDGPQRGSIVVAGDDVEPVQRPVELGELRPPTLLFAVSVAGFASPNQNDEVQLTIRDALYRLLIAAFQTCGIAWDNCHHEDRVDGVLVIIPLHMPTIVVIDPLLPRLQAAIRRHNRLSCAIAQIRLRIAVHIGEVHRDRYGVAGIAVNHLFRLLAARAVKEALTVSGSELAMIVSGYVYESVLHPAGEFVDLSEFRPVDVALNRTRARAWIRMATAVAA